MFNPISITQASVLVLVVFRRISISIKLNEVALCAGNLANNLQLVLIASRVPCFGVEALKVPELPIPQSLCCLKFQLRRAHYPVRTVCAQCRAHFRALTLAVYRAYWR